MALNLIEQETPSRIEMLPLIDVIFLLLVFFIYTIINMQVIDTIEVDLPQVATTNQEIKDPIVVSIDKDNILYLGKKKVTFKELSALLATKMTKSKESAVLVNGDHKADLGVVLQLVKMFQDLNLTNFAFRQEEKNE